MTTATATISAITAATTTDTTTLEHLLLLLFCLFGKVYRQSPDYITAHLAVLRFGYRISLGFNTAE